MNSSTKTSREDWQPLVSVAVSTLTDARLQLHWATQVVASVGVSFLDPRPDDSHPNLGWSDAHGALVGHAVTGSQSVRAGIRFHDLTILVLSSSDDVLAQVPLGGSTFDEVHRALGAALHSVAKLGPELKRAPYDIPAHGVGEGRPFGGADATALDHLGRWYANAHRVFTEVREREDHASVVRCWPHHFDIATLIALDPDRDPETAPSIGVGMTPGDASYESPYIYVNPWPRPPVESLGEAAHGHWHTEGWMGLVLTAEDVWNAPDQAAEVDAYIKSSIAACRELLIS